MRIRIAISLMVAMIALVLLARPMGVKAIPNCPPNCPAPPIVTPTPGPPPPTPTPIPEDSIENMPVWRAQVRFTTGDVKNAGTDDSVKVQLRSDNVTWVDYGRDDFERGDTFTYDLTLDNINRLNDITKLKIAKTGSDGWCVRSLDLIINGRVIYTRNFNSPCLWLDNDNGHSRSYTVVSSRLRAHPRWRSYRQPFPPLVIPHEEMESRVESILGDNIHGTKLYWGHLHGRAVEVTKKDDQTIHVDLDLAYGVTALPDPEVDIDFDLRFACSAGEITLTTLNVDVDVDSAWYYEVVSLGLIEILDYKVENGIEDAFTAINEAIDTGQSVCPTITILHDGSVLFGL